jgi:anti-sigma factor RsiW
VSIETTHQEVTGLFSAFIDHELPVAELEKFVSHVEACEGCAVELEAFEKTVESVRGLQRERAPVAFSRLVLRRVRHRNRRSAAVAPYLNGSFHLPVEAAIPIVLAAVLALLLLLMK